MNVHANITKRVRHRKTSLGAVVHHTRWVLNYTDPISGRRRQQFFATASAASARRAELIAQVATNSYVEKRTAPTVAEALDHWLDDKRTKVKLNTLAGYMVVAAHIRGAALQGGAKPSGIGAMKISDLTTGDIRTWHRHVTLYAGPYTANRARSFLRSVLAMAEEDFRVRAPAMPEGLGRGRQRARKAILMPDQIAAVIAEARRDTEHGIYYVFPFLAGTRPSEQLGLLWEAVDFDAGVIHIRRIQERDGSLTSMTKTEAGTRDVPMGPVLRELLLSWRVRCPRRAGELHRVFPGPGRLQPWPKPRLGGGGALLYQNFRTRLWAPMFKKLGLPYVTPHSGRHSYISTMQAAGVEVGLVAKLAGHASANVTLGHYTQAVRGGAVAAEALESAYGGKTVAPVPKESGTVGWNPSGPRFVVVVGRFAPTGDPQG